MKYLALTLISLAVAARVSAFSLGTSPQTAVTNHAPSHHHHHHHHHHSKLFASGGFGGGGASSKTKGKKGGKGKQQKQSSSNKKMSAVEAKRAQKQLAERYGGDIGKGTQERIQSSLASLEPHLQEAAELYKAITQFDAIVAPMTPADRNRLIPPEQAQMVEADRSKLQSLMEGNNLSELDLHNVYQRITWDASADAKATQADIVGNQMKAKFQERITKACTVAVQAAECEGAKGKVLDVGCGHGAIVKSLVDAGLSEPDMYVGIDLSPEMVKNGEERYGTARNGRTGKGRTFIADDFYTHDFGGEAAFDSIIFCSTLHDLPDVEGAILRASSLLRKEGGKVIVVHAQGAQHVLVSLFHNLQAPPMAISLDKGHLIPCS